VKDLLNSLVQRGIDASVQRLFVIDGSKAIRSAIEQVYGEQGLVQRCRAHKVRNVSERLPEPARAQTKSVMHAAYRLPEKEGMAKLKQGQVAASALSGCSGELVGRAGGDLHGQSPQTHASADALFVYHQHH
jgi:hypothetical protein